MGQGRLQEAHPSPPATGTVTLLQLSSSNLKRCHTASDAASCFAYTDPCASRPAALETTTPFLTGETPGPDRSNDLTKVTMAVKKRSGYRPRASSLRSQLGSQGSRSPPGFGGAVATHPGPVVCPPPSLRPQRKRERVDAGEA